MATNGGQIIFCDQTFQMYECRKYVMYVMDKIHFKYVQTYFESVMTNLYAKLAKIFEKQGNRRDMRKSRDAAIFGVFRLCSLGVCTKFQVSIAF